MWGGEDGGDARFDGELLKTTSDKAWNCHPGAEGRGWEYIVTSVQNLVVDGESDTHSRVPSKCGTCQPLSS
jgi:hypothetical protein